MIDYVLILWVAAVVVTYFIWGSNAALGVLTIGIFTAGARFAEEQNKIKAAETIKQRKQSDAKIDELPADRVHSDLDKWVRDKPKK